MVNDNGEKSTGGVDDSFCTYCEMAVVWMQNQVGQNKTIEQILTYIDKVNYDPSASIEDLVLMKLFIS